MVNPRATGVQHGGGNPLAICEFAPALGDVGML